MSAAWLLIVAAGRGERLGQEGPKAFVELGGTALVSYALEAGGATPSVGSLLAVGDVERLVALIPSLSPAVGAKWRGAVPGGAERSESVRRGCTEIQRQADGDPVVLVHDAARPFASPDLLESVSRAALRGPAIAASAVADTVKRRHGCRIEGTLERETLALAQTPQGARLSALLAAQEAYSGRSATDEATLFEAAGFSVRIVPAPATNFKVTMPEDLRLAEAWVRAGGTPWMPGPVPHLAPGQTADRSSP